jgi:hypothetical protein
MLLRNASCELSKTSQETTPIGRTRLHVGETVTVTDVRHPLYGKTMPLISVEQRRDAGLCCVVDEVGINTRYIPIAATNKSSEPMMGSSIPLSLKAVQQLQATYQQIVEGQQDEGCDAIPGSRTKERSRIRNGEVSPATPSLDTSDATAATASDLESGKGLLRVDAPAEQSSGGRQ